MVDDTSFTSIIPVLSVRSVDGSIEYYTTVLGFDKDWEWPFGEGEKTFGSVSHGAVTVFFNKRKDQEARPFCVYYYVKDVDKLNEVYKTAGANITEEPTDKPWRMREMLVTDPDGHVLRIGSPLEHEHEHEDGGEDH